MILVDNVTSLIESIVINEPITGIRSKADILVNESNRFTSGKTIIYNIPYPEEVVKKLSKKNKIISRIPMDYCEVVPYKIQKLNNVHSTGVVSPLLLSRYSISNIHYDYDEIKEIYYFNEFLFSLDNVIDGYLTSIGLLTNTLEILNDDVTKLSLTNGLF